MANEQNLISLGDRDPEERFAIQSKGGKAAQAKYRKAKSMRDAARILLESPLLEDDAETAELLLQMGLEPDQQGAILLAAIKQAKRGDMESARYARDTSGQAPAQQVEVGGMDGKPIETLDLGSLSTEELEKILAEADKDTE